MVTIKLLYILNIQCKLLKFSNKIELDKLITKERLMIYHRFSRDKPESNLIFRTQGQIFT